MCDCAVVRRAPENRVNKEKFNKLTFHAADDNKLKVSPACNTSTNVVAFIARSNCLVVPLAAYYIRTHKTVVLLQGP